MTSDVDSDEQVADTVDWTSVPADPDLAEDLGYDINEMDVIKTNNGSGQVLLLPSNEEDLRDECFMVVQEDTLVNLIDSC